VMKRGTATVSWEELSAAVRERRGTSRMEK
jgi:hypothetical protein